MLEDASMAHALYQATMIFENKKRYILNSYLNLIVEFTMLFPVNSISFILLYVLIHLLLLAVFRKAMPECITLSCNLLTSSPTS